MERSDALVELPDSHSLLWTIQEILPISGGFSIKSDEGNVDMSSEVLRRKGIDGTKLRSGDKLLVSFDPNLAVKDVRLTNF